MYKEIKLSSETGDSVTVPMKSNAATAIRYRGIFHEEIPLGGDIQVLFATAIAELGVKNLDDDEAISKASIAMDRAAEKVRKLAFVMAMAARGEKMGELTQDNYITWLEQFDASSFDDDKNTEIWSVYQKTANNSSTEKKRDARLQE